MSELALSFSQYQGVWHGVLVAGDPWLARLGVDNPVALEDYIILCIHHIFPGVVELQTGLYIGLNRPSTQHVLSEMVKDKIPLWARFHSISHHWPIVHCPGLSWGE